MMIIFLLKVGGIVCMVLIMVLVKIFFVNLYLFFVVRRYILNVDVLVVIIEVFVVVFVNMYLEYLIFVKFRLLLF